MADAEKFGARGTPNFFINGRNFRGAQPIEAFKSVIDDEIKKADAKMAAGTPRGQLYAALIQGRPRQGRRAAATGRRDPGEPDAEHPLSAPRSRARRCSGGQATRRSRSCSGRDFQCPFCSARRADLAKVMDDYKGDGARGVARPAAAVPPQRRCPRPSRRAPPASRGSSGRCTTSCSPTRRTRDSRDLREVRPGPRPQHGQVQGGARRAEGQERPIEADAAAGGKIGAHGTPAFFINGKFLSGAQPYEIFKAKIDEELKVADAMIAKGTPKTHVYEVLMKDAKTELPAPRPRRAGRSAGRGEDARAGHHGLQGSAPTGPAKGSKNAPLQVVIFSDFQCPFCKRVEPQLSQLEKDYGSKVHMVWKNYPLPVPQQRRAGGRGGHGGGRQGKFWEMHDKLFENNTALDRANLEKYAQELGLNMAKFKADLDAQKYKDQIQPTPRRARRWA